MSAIPPDSCILVTGVNGYVASHTADQLLHHGYRVRGTVRSPSKSQWIKDLFDRKYGPGRFELATVEDMTRPDAFDRAIKGVSGIAHVATIFGHTADLIASVVATNENLLASAAAEPTVRRFVYTSSSEAATFSSFLDHQDGRDAHITANTWNEEAVRRYQHDGAEGPKAGFDMYAASKTLGEQAVWKWVEENRPGFVVNTVLPSVVFGASIAPEAQGHASSSAWPAALFRNEFDRVWPFLQHVIPHGAYCVDAKDVALLHLAGLVHADVKSERLFAFGVPFTWNEIISVFQAWFPDRQFASEVPGQTGAERFEIEPAARAQEVLREMGKSDFSSLEEMLKANVSDLVEGL
ncbi:NAD(P)-binding protein [Aspergillus steynii IBT 23096]|uniref:NAD(P)-binding protein n=1 Tax=Aspergillus steynii IBT 23096 TaxID=1392250 RepID=A0A2I2GPJ0_9EURO|nr:NAD(P)-binding protein [Aspergillus steynii IBT 23096]PLB54788.1 NAD(P)-binding protein [Aspergillus steynii IBT 23096]